MISSLGRAPNAEISPRSLHLGRVLRFQPNIMNIINIISINNVIGLDKGTCINILISSLGPALNAEISPRSMHLGRVLELQPNISLGPALNAEISPRSLHLGRVPGLKSMYLCMFHYVALFKPNIISIIIIIIISIISIIRIIINIVNIVNISNINNIIINNNMITSY